MAFPTRAELDDAVDSIVSSLTPTDRQLLQAWVSIPNIPDCQPEVLKVTRNGHNARLDPILEMMGYAERRLDLPPDTLKLAILAKLVPPPRM